MCADKAVGLEASDLLSLGSQWIPQSTVRSKDYDWARMTKANGDFHMWSDEFGGMMNLTSVYRWGDTVGLGAALPNVGSVSGGYMITEMNIETVYNDWPTITFTAHQHDENVHSGGVQYEPSTEIQSIVTGALGALDYASLAASEVCAQSSSYTLSVNHLDEDCSSAEHWTGNNIQGVESVSINYIGLIGTFTVGNWWTSNYSLNDSNEAFDTSSITMEKYLTRYEA